MSNAAMPPNFRMLATSKVRDVGIERNLMKFVIVTQWVRAIRVKSHLTKA